MANVYQPHIMIVRAPYYQHIVDDLLTGALESLKTVDATHEVFDVAGALEIPGAVRMALKGYDFYTGRRRFDGYIALGCVIRGQTSHYDHICNETFRGLQDLVLNFSIALGNGVLTCDNEEQAIARSKGDSKKHKGKEAAHACLSLLEVKHAFGLYPRD